MPSPLQRLSAPGKGKNRFGWHCGRSMAPWCACCLRVRRRGGRHLASCSLARARLCLAPEEKSRHRRLCGGGQTEPAIPAQFTFLPAAAIPKPAFRLSRSLVQRDKQPAAPVPARSQPDVQKACPARNRQPRQPKAHRVPEFETPVCCRFGRPARALPALYRKPFSTIPRPPLAAVPRLAATPLSQLRRSRQGYR